MVDSGLHSGAALADAQAAMLLIHGRGADAADILNLAREWPRAGWAFLAPQAAGNTWYPQSFLAPLERNEPWLSTALATVDALVHTVMAAGIPPTRLVLLGFSQGACLALEYAVRVPQRYGGVVGFSGGLIGPPGTRWPATGDLAGTPVFLGCSDHDAHIPAERVTASATAFQALHASVTQRFYPHLGHAINADELDWVRTLLPTLA